jgi:hypothetical protein
MDSPPPGPKRKKQKKERPEVGKLRDAEKFYDKYFLPLIEQGDVASGKLHIQTLDSKFISKIRELLLEPEEYFTDLTGPDVGVFEKGGVKTHTHSLSCEVLSSHTHPSQDRVINPPSGDDMQSLSSALFLRCLEGKGYMSHVVFSREGVYVFSINPKIIQVNNAKGLEHFLGHIWSEDFRDSVDWLAGANMTEETFVTIQEYIEVSKLFYVYVKYYEWPTTGQDLDIEYFTFKMKTIEN